jgi:hypothetical protein
MKLYANSKISGIEAYETWADFIILKFTDGGVYLYNKIKPGKDHVEHMKQLAQSGHGLNTYINKYIRNNYFAQLK